MRFSMKTKALAAMAVFALALAGIAVIPASDAEDMNVAIDTDKGTMTLTVAKIIEADSIEALLGTCEGATYKIALANDITLDFGNMSDYELIKPYIKNGFVVITAEDVKALGDGWGEFQTAIGSFLETDAEADNFVAFADGEWSGAVQTVIVMQTPAASDAEWDALLEAANAAIEEKDAQIAELQAAIDADESAATIAALTADKEAQAAVIAELEAALADLKAKNADLSEGDTPLWDTGLGKCLIIIVAFLAGLVVWYLYKEGKFDKIVKRKQKKAAEAPKE